MVPLQEALAAAAVVRFPAEPVRVSDRVTALEEELPPAPVLFRPGSGDPAPLLVDLVVGAARPHVGMRVGRVEVELREQRLLVLARQCHEVAAQLLAFDDEAPRSSPLFDLRPCELFLANELVVVAALGLWIGADFDLLSLAGALTSCAEHSPASIANTAVTRTPAMTLIFMDSISSGGVGNRDTIAARDRNVEHLRIGRILSDVLQMNRSERRSW